ncbi:T9SS type A sorting domain-containing protein [Neolewinella antarctica]|uniref:Fibronectin type-III domain-containing protein n=1 Tax=Neolewinella antarctica TaxID=442734 RepID=A0ABX0XEB1_9BACT|nr:T9SS type A sorting domain-containing protein [Neolewinella antarctica]NJC27653.1 hypothetical protein [Neolewinella antarctica]
MPNQFPIYFLPRRVLTLLFLCSAALNLTAQATAEIVYFDQDSCLRYRADNQNNYLPDFSHAGYKNGTTALPTVPTVLTIQPVAGDNTASIQAALNQVADRTPDANGYRGALLLDPGTYVVSGQLFMRASGVVLRGSGQGTDASANTIISGVGNVPEKRDLIVVRGEGSPTWRNPVAGSTSNVTSDFVPAGSRSLEVAAAEFYRVGDKVIITQPSTPEWLASIDNGATADDAGWSPGTIDLYYNRVITGVNIPENKVTLDVPVFDHLDRALAQSEIYVFDDRTILREVGIENLRIDIESTDPLDEDHARNAIFLNGVEDAWVRNVTALHFSYALVDMSVSNRVTVTGCSAREPHSPITGGRRYNFCVSTFTNNVLFTDNRAEGGRHSFVSNGTSSVSGIVFHDAVSDNDYSPSEGHRRWSQGLLYDNIDFINSSTRNLIGLYNRGSFGTGHGWASTNSVAWNVSTPPTRGIIIQQPPRRQNYAVGCRSNVTGAGPFAQPAGYIELSNQELAIPSLYAAQLAQRMARGVGPDAPARLSRVPLPGSDISLRWIDVAANETGYEVVVSSDGGATDSVLVTLPPNTFFYATPYPTGSGEFIYRVYATGADCPSPFSNTLTFTGSGTTATREAAAAEFTVSPNPVTDRLTIAADEPYESVEVFNAGGALILKSGRQDTLDASRWPAGIYFLKIKMRNGEYLSSQIVKK